MRIKEAFHEMYRVRFFEEKLLELFSLGKISGTTHTYSGQEAVGYSVINNLDKEDIVFSNHRCHGHFLFKEKDPAGLLNEILGNKDGVCEGFGGSQHLHKNNFFSSGIQGGYASICAGMAFDQKIKKNNNITCCFIGDGTFGEGSLYECLNFSSLLSVPILFVVENNNYAQTTNIKDNLSGKISKRFEAFEINYKEFFSNNIFEIYDQVRDIIAHQKKKNIPYALIFNTYRFNAHSKGDDFRDKDEISNYKEKYDPLSFLEKEISSNEIISIKKKVKEEINQILLKLL